ncbi:MAG: PspC domain-containing protein [Saprospiraceae bacterium]|nr:PspC domain-containing protein [Saprospiraceae bacterium]
MNKTFNINLGSYPFAIDEDAYEYIQNYLDTIRRHFSASDGCEEILYDIEVRMAELFQEHLKGRAIISMKEIDEVIMIMGKPEDFGAEPMAESHQSSTRGKKSDTKIKPGKRLFRDPDDKKLAGVCSGISAYLGIEDPLWVRLIFAILLFTGTGVITYIILWALVPEASNAGDKLAMRGEPATIHNIAKVVEEELTDLGDKLNEWSKDLGSKKKSDDVNQGFQAKSILAEGVNMIGKVASNIIPVIRQIFKPIVIVSAIVLLSVLGISWAASFVGLSFAAPVMFSMGPDSTFLSYLGIGSLFFTIGLPILGIMLFVARLGFGYRIHKNIKTGFWTVWFLSLFSSMFAGMSTIKDYSSRHEFNTMTDYNIESQDIHIAMPEENLDHTFGIHMDKFFVEKGDQWAVRDVTLKVEKSKDALVHVERFVSARGSDLSEAQQNSLYVGNDLTVNGNEISISKFLTIPRKNKYRNQSVDYVIYVPEGKNVSFDNNVKERMRESSLFSWDQIYTDMKDLKWTVKGNSVFSGEWNNLMHHKKEIAAGSYSKVIIEKGFDVIITKAEKANVNIEGHKDVVDKIYFKNLEGTLTLNTDNDEDVDGVVITIQTPSLELIHLDGVRTAKIEGFSQDNLKLISKGEFNGSDETSISFFGNIKNMDISLDGDQKLTMTGQGENLEIQLDNGASINGDKYQVKTATWLGFGSENSSLHVTETLSCDDPDANHLKLIGNPKKVKIQK